MDIENLVEALKKKFPHGHPEFIPEMIKKIKLHSEKNYDYAHGGDPLGNFRRSSAFFGLYPGLDLSDPVVLCLVLMFKQLDSVLWMKAQGYTGQIEDVGRRLDDVVVYAQIAGLLQNEGEVL